MFTHYIQKFCFRYRGEILEVIDNVTAKVGLIDVGNFHVLRNIGEIFQMPLKYKGKSLVSTYLYSCMLSIIS